MKKNIIEGLRVKRGHVAQPDQGPAPPVPVWASWLPSLTSCAPEGSHDKILMPEKSKVKLSSGRFLKRQNT
jgi:hypothetical protein